MNSGLYKVYRLLTRVKRRTRRKMTHTGRVLTTFAALAILFGFNTRLTMIYQLAALAVGLLVVAFPLSLIFTPRLRIWRALPATCTAGEKLTYLLQVENTGNKGIAGLFFREQSGAGFPSLADFRSIPEEGERNRNLIDRTLGYYRWLWLLERMTGARFPPCPLPRILPGERVQVEASLLPLRRGYVRIDGYSVYRVEPLGLFKKEVFFHDAGRILVLPRIYPVAQTDFTGSRKYHQGGLSSAASYGDSGEFVSLREYRAGDPVKHIDWKATARVGSGIVRQYQEEYFSRYGILLDTFAGHREGRVFEDAVSVAASIVAHRESTDTLVDLLFAGDLHITALSMGRGQSARHHMLEAVACITRCRAKTFSDLAETVMANVQRLSGLILILIDLEESRVRLIKDLRGMGIPVKVILVSADREASARSAARMSLPDITLFDVNGTSKLVDLR